MLTKAGLLRTKKQLLFSSDLRSLFVCAGEGEFAAATISRQKQGVLRGFSLQCFASLSLHGILIDQGENDPLKIRQKKSLRKSTYSRTFSKIIIEQQLQ